MYKAIITVTSVGRSGKLGVALRMVDSAAGLDESRSARSDIEITKAIAYVVWLKTVDKSKVAHIVPGVVIRVQFIGPRLVGLGNVAVSPP